MKIIVSGSESFIGKELISLCLNEGVDVFGFDLAKHSDLKYEFQKGDIRDRTITDILPDGADAVVHLAAISRDIDCVGRAYECFETNVMGTLNLARAAKTKRAKQFIFASSEWVYGDFYESESKNEDSVIDISKNPSEYAFSKFVSEVNLKQEYGRGFCPVTILRFGIIYGPRATNWSAVESLMSAVKKQDKVSVGSLKTGRRFVHVSDIAGGVIAAIGLQGFEIINLVGREITTLGDVIGESEKILNKKVEREELNPDKISIRNPSSDKAKRVLNWEAKIGLNEGLKTLLPFV